MKHTGNSNQPQKQSTLPRRGQTRVPVYEDLLQAGVDEIGHQLTVVSADSLDAFAVHLVMCFRIG